MHNLDNNTSIELDASRLPPLSDRIRFFQQGGKLSSPANKVTLEDEEEDEYVEPPIDYSSPPPVSVRKLLFNNSDTIGHETNCSPLFRSKSKQSGQKSSSPSIENSVAARAKLLHEKVLKEEKKAKQKNKIYSDEEEEIEKDVPPELLSLADRVKKFSSISPPKKSSKKYGSAATTTPSQSYRKLNHNIPPLVPSSPTSSASSSSSHASSSYHDSSVASNCFDVNESFASMEEREEEISPAPPSHDDNDEFTIIKRNSTLPYYRNWKSGTSGGGNSNRKVWKFPTHSNNNHFNPENGHFRKPSTSPVDWDNSDQLSMASSASGITY